MSKLLTQIQYIYITIGLIIIGITQYILLNLLNLESSVEQSNQLGASSFNNTLVNQIIFILAVSIITPIKEEVLYRGVLSNLLTERHNFIIGIGLSSFIFGYLHPGFPITAMIMGVVFAYLFYKTKSLFPSIILHILWNLIAGFLLLNQ